MRTVEIGHDYDLSKPPYPLEEFNKLSVKVGDALDLDMDKILHDAPANWLDYKSYRKWICRLAKLKLS